MEPLLLLQPYPLYTANLSSLSLSLSNAFQPCSEGGLWHSALMAACLKQQQRPWCGSRVLRVCLLAMVRVYDNGSMYNWRRSCPAFWVEFRVT